MTKLNKLEAKTILLFESSPASIEAKKPNVQLELHQLKENFNYNSQAIAKERPIVGNNAGWPR